MSSIDLSQYKAPRKKSAPKTESNFSLLEILNRDISFSKNQLSNKKREAFYLELSTLLLSSVDLKTSLDLIVADQEKENEKALVESIKNAVLHGSALSDALSATGKFSFSLYEYYSIKIGEETGRIG